MRYLTAMLLILAMLGCQAPDKPKLTKQERKERRESIDVPENAPIGQRELKGLRDIKQERDDINKQYQDQQQDLNQAEQ
jgi:hypothetical protein